MAGAERKARIGFIGAGWWATANHMPVLAGRDDVELTAVCRLGADELQQVRQQFGFEYATEDYRKLLDEVELDGVVVASPAHTSLRTRPGRPRTRLARDVRKAHDYDRRSRPRVG